MSYNPLYVITANAVNEIEGVKVRQDVNTPSFYMAIISAGSKAGFEHTCNFLKEKGIEPVTDPKEFDSFFLGSFTRRTKMNVAQIKFEDYVQLFASSRADDVKLIDNAGAFHSLFEMKANLTPISKDR